MRNKILLLVIVMVAVVGKVWSQTETVEEVNKTRWGIKGGLNTATVYLESGSNSASLESVVGAVAGITLEHLLAPNWFFHSGLEASMKGFGFGSGSNSTLESTAVYLEIPAAVGYKFNIGKGWNLEPRAGLYFAYGVAGNTSAGSNSVSTFGDKILKPFDAGVLFGFFLDNDKIVIGLQGESGFTETNGDSFKVTGAKAHSSNMSITVGYLF